MHIALIENFNLKFKMYIYLCDTYHTIQQTYRIHTAQTFEKSTQFNRTYEIMYHTYIHTRVCDTSNFHFDMILSSLGISINGIEYDTDT